MGLLSHAKFGESPKVFTNETNKNHVVSEISRN